MRSIIILLTISICLMTLFKSNQVQAAPIKVPQVWMDDQGKIIAMAIDENGDEEEKREQNEDHSLDQDFINYLKSSIHENEEELNDNDEDFMYLTDDSTLQKNQNMDIKSNFIQVIRKFFIQNTLDY
ncbi:unnamed protein product [Cunninghamella blakesleeana]